MKFLKDPNTRSYDRGVITILEVIGNVGGLMGIFVVGGGFLVNIFQEKIFFYEIFSKMFQVQNKQDPSEVSESSVNHHDYKEVSDRGEKFRTKPALKTASILKEDLTMTRRLIFQTDYNPL